MLRLRIMRHFSPTPPRISTSNNEVPRLYRRGERTAAADEKRGGDAREHTWGL